MSAVSISVVPDEIVIKPQEAFTDWAKVWDGIKEARATKGSASSMPAAARRFYGDSQAVRRRACY